MGNLLSKIMPGVANCAGFAQHFDVRFVEIINGIEYFTENKEELGIEKEKKEVVKKRERGRLRERERFGRKEGDMKKKGLRKRETGRKKKEQRKKGKEEKGLRKGRECGIKKGRGERGRVK